MSGFYPLNPNLDQVMQSDVEGVVFDLGFLAHFQISAANAVAADNDAVHATIDCSSDTKVEVTTGFANPAVPRNITATVACDTAANIKAVQVKVTGTNYLDEVITEDLPAFTDNTAGTVIGNKAFKTVTKVEIPAMDGAGVTVTIGFGDKLGLPKKLAHNTVLFAFLNNVKESTPPTVAVSATAIDGNTVDLNSALDGHVVDVYLIV
ncbi:MAG: hypothetical protein GXY34_00115 [Syntrophomonadaceae bacterium]|nr:hypothetical protein [Syntrophomonadaceae bacterium]